jgi:hypothetical protein
MPYQSGNWAVAVKNKIITTLPGVKLGVIAEQFALT